MKNKIRIFIVVILLTHPAVLIQAQESEYKDTPYFSGMPNYMIYDAEDVEFDSYNFFNGKNCTAIEGKKLKRTYTIKEDAPKSSVIQISRNYANAVRNMGGTVIFEGAPQTAECADNNGLQMMIGKVVKDGNEMWIEVVPTGDGGDYYLTVVITEMMKKDVKERAIFTEVMGVGRMSVYINF